MLTVHFNNPNEYYPYTIMPFAVKYERVSCAIMNVTQSSLLAHLRTPKVPGDVCLEISSRPTCIFSRAGASNTEVIT